MRIRFASRVLTMAAIACVTVTPLAGQRDNVPVKLEFVVPPDVKTGDEVETVLSFRALEDLQQLDVNVFPVTGLELLSETREAVFTSVRRGTSPELRVRIRLTDPKSGSLAVTYGTRTEARRAAGAITIVYGARK